MTYLTLAELKEETGVEAWTTTLWPQTEEDAVKFFKTTPDKIYVVECCMEGYDDISKIVTNRVGTVNLSDQFVSTHYKGGEGTDFLVQEGKFDGCVTYAWKKE
jgi:hypothetical protein